MRRSSPRLHACSLATLAAIVIMPCRAAETGPPPPSSSQPPADLAKRVREVTDAVLQHHIEPPARQQMVLGGIRALHAAAGVAPPSGLGRRVSDVATPEEFATLLAETWPRTPSRRVSPEALESALLNGLLENVPGASRISTKEARVAAQLEGNLYVGIQIALGFSDAEKRPQIMQVFEKGPADRAGIVANELIEEIEGQDTKEMSVTEAVERLRGEEGTAVTIKVRPAKAKEGRSLMLRREKLARETITGVRKRPAGGWDLRLEGPEPIGYLRIGEILGSTPHELRQVASRLESEGIRALVLDLRNCGHANLHASVLLGDEFLDGGTIGLVKEADKVTTYRATPDALFRGWPVVVLIDDGTTGPAEWLAAALQDNHRATLVGSPTRGFADVRTTLPLADGAWSIQMTTGRLERGDGRAIAAPAGPESRVIVRRMPSPNARKGGVQPDHPMAPTRPVPPGRRSNGPARAEPAKATDDPWIKKAMDIIYNDMGSV